MILFYLVSSKRMAEFVPAPLTVVQVMPGVTLGGFYAASYRTGGGGAFSEFSVFPALVRYQKKKGLFVSCSMVESPASPLGRKGAWGLRKERANFEWKREPSHISLRIFCEARKVIDVGIKTYRVSLPARVSFPFFHVRSSGVVSYHADYVSRVYLSSSSVEIPEESPIGVYGFSRKLMTTLWDSAKIVIHPPESEKNVVLIEGVSEGIFQIGRDRIDSCGARQIPMHVLTRGEDRRS